MSIKGVIFDMDGVLVDNMYKHIEAFDIFGKRYGVSDLSEKLIAYAGMGNDEIMQALLPADVVAQKGLAALAYEKEALYREVYASEIKPIAGLLELLKELKIRGVKCAVGSSGCRENVEFVIDSCGLKEYFEVLIYSDLVSKCKPDPEIYLTAMERLGVSTEESLIFEDAIVGIEAAHRSKAAKIIALSTTLPKEKLEADSYAQEVFADYTEMMPHLDRLLK